MVFLRRLNENTRLNIILVKKVGDKYFKFIQQDKDSTWDGFYPLFEKVKNRFYYNLQWVFWIVNVKYNGISNYPYVGIWISKNDFSDLN